MASTIHGAAKSIPCCLSIKLRPYSVQLADRVQQIDIDAPLTISFCCLCIVIQLFHGLLGESFIFYFTVPSYSHFSVYSVVSYIRMLTHVAGHSSWDHLFHNLVNILLVGPSCEHHFGGLVMIKIVVLSALASSVAFVMYGPRNSYQLGASGVVFTLILLSSLARVRRGYVPLTFVCQAVIWCTKELVGVFFYNDRVSHIAHLSGAIVGTAAGYYFNDIRTHQFDRSTHSSRPSIDSLTSSLFTTSSVSLKKSFLGTFSKED